MPLAARAPSSFPRRGMDRLVLFTIDADGDIPGRHQLGFGHQDQRHQDQYDDGEHHHPKNHLLHCEILLPHRYREIPENDMKPSAMSPAVMKVIPNPRRPAGTSEYFIFSRIPASSTMARHQLKPDPRP